MLSIDVIHVQRVKSLYHENFLLLQTYERCGNVSYFIKMCFSILKTYDGYIASRLEIEQKIGTYNLSYSFDNLSRSSNTTERSPIDHI